MEAYCFVRQARKEIVLETLNKKVFCRECDLADFNSIRKFVKDFQQEESKLDVLVNNGGIMRCPRMVTKQGIEMQLGVNHMGHFLLTNLLLDNLKVSDESNLLSMSTDVIT
jgi:NAD(P)-dependent dehydrogenase (short-subunit alcohol dehydrogenase family)